MATIQGIYIALFGRPADPQGLAFWEAETKGGTDLSSLIGRLTQSSEYLDRFEGQSQEEIVSSIYLALFGRDPDAAGLAFFIDALQSGSQTIETIAINILDGALGADATIIENKEAAADLFTTSLDTPEEIAAYIGDDAADVGRDFISEVTADPTSIPTQAEVDQKIDQGVVNSPEVPTEPGGGGGGGGGNQPLPEQIDSDAVITVDRRAPASGSIDDDGNLTLTINPGVETSGFERYQGYIVSDAGQNYDVDQRSIFSTTLTIGEDWTVDDNAQLTGVWIRMQNEDRSLPSGGIFSIVEYLDADAAELVSAQRPEDNVPEDFSGGFRFWNSDEGWTEYVEYDVSDLSEVSLRFTFEDEAHTWRVNGQVLYRDTTSTNVENADVIENVIFNSQNFGAEQTYSYSDISLVGIRDTSFAVTASAE